VRTAHTETVGVALVVPTFEPGVLSDEGDHDLVVQSVVSVCQLLPLGERLPGFGARADAQLQARHQEGAQTLVVQQQRHAVDGGDVVDSVHLKTGQGRILWGVQRVH
jgi:hypothetical protein